MLSDFHALDWRKIMFLFFDFTDYDADGNAEKRRAYLCVTEAYLRDQPPHFPHVRHVYTNAGRFNVISGESDEEQGGDRRLSWVHVNGANTFPEENVTAIRLARD